MVVGVRYFFPVCFLACFSACLLASFIISYLLYLFRSGPCVFSQLEDNSSHCQVSQFTGPAYTGKRWCVQRLLNSVCCCQLAQMGKISSSLNLHFVWLYVFVLNTDIRISAVLKAGSVFWQVALAPAINSPFLNKS